MLQPIRYFSTFLFLCWPFWQVFAQTLPPLQPEQDCINAIPVCQNVYVQTNSYTGEGNDPNEIGDDSCLGTEENNDVWYIFTVQVSGNLCFTITPNDPLDDYDWAVYNLTTANCNDIRNTPSLEVSCNFAPNVGCNGLTGPNNDTMGSCARQNEPCVPVLAGQTYAVNVSNYSETNFGYTLDFSASSAVIFDNIPPELVAANSSCADVSVVFSENVLCSSVEPTDFTISGPDSVLHSVSAVMSENCAGGGNFDNLFALTISPPILVPGLYTIDLSGEVEDNCGNIGTEGSAIIDIQVNTVNVTANPDTICEGSTTRLTTDVDPASAVAYLWMPGGMTQPDPQVSPDTTTTYFVGVTDTAGCLFSGSVTVAVEPLPDATFGVSDSIVCPEESVLLTYQGDAGPDAVFAWNFGDAVVMSGADAGPYELRWASPGTKTISLKVKERGCTSLEYQQQVEVIPPPTAEFSLPAGVCNFSQAQIQYTGNASPTATFDWDFDGGVVTNGTGDGPGPHAVEWNAPGPREVSLIVTDNGCVSEVGLQRLQVFNLPQASIAPVEGQCLPGNQFRFYYDGGSNVLTYQWDFGDSTANDLSHPLHTYRSAGTKTVQLTVTDANQCQNTASTTVEVFAPPSADFTLANACQQDSLQITNLSTGPGGQPLAAFRWEFGDGGSTTAAAPVHQYTQPGSYQVILIAESSQGCKDTTRQMLTVYPRPAVRFTSQDVCEGLPAAFTNTSTIRSDIASDVIQE
ncbi:MAG: PKD domain-containing protein, partial [Bacteroidetes bacterium]